MNSVNRSISYVAGARGDFLSNFLWNPYLNEKPILSNDGAHTSYHYVKFHSTTNLVPFNQNIFIDYDIKSNEMITFFMWDKTIKHLFHSTSDFDNFTKIYFTMLDSWFANQTMRKNKFTHILNFCDLFNNDFMIDFFKKINGVAPSNHAINFLQQDNQRQTDNFNKKIKFHPARIAHKIFEFEYAHHLDQSQRNWSIVKLWKQHLVSSNNFLIELDEYLNLQYYSISDIK